METARSGFLGVSSSRLTAYVAVLLLVAVVGWNFGSQPSKASSQIQTSVVDSTSTDDGALSALAASASTDYQGVTPLGASIFAQAVVAYDKATQQASSTDAGLAAVENFGATIKPPVNYTTYAAGDVKTSTDNSKDRIIAYRADLRVALAPLLDNKDNELDLFGQYVDTKDAKYLDALRAASQNYKLAIANTEKVVAPSDAAVYQASILTAMSRFAATLDAMTDNSSDAFASSALLRTYIDAQDDMLASFNSIGKYSAQKLL